MSEMLIDKQELVNELEKVNTRLLESEKLKSHFLSNIKNEINNPITSMLGLLKQMIQHPDEVEKNLKMVNMIYRDTFILNGHLQNIFMAAELEAGELVPEYQRVNIIELLESIIHSFDGIYDHHVNISVESSGDQDFVTDRMVLRAVLNNLLSNALKFSEDGGEVIIHVFISEKQMELLFEDFGVGIDAKDREVIFNRFRQLDTGTTKAYGGHGLGLSVVQAGIELLEGRVFVESEKDRGSKFKVNLPSGEITGEENLFGDEFLFDSEADETF